MRKTRKKLNPLLFSATISLACILILTLVSSLILLSSQNPTGSVGLATVLLFPLAAAVTAIATTLYKGESAIRECLISSLLVSGLVISLGLIFSGGSFPFSALLNCAAFTLSSLAISILARPKAKRRRR